jgi:hypothetical protein
LSALVTSATLTDADALFEGSLWLAYSPLTVPPLMSTLIIAGRIPLFQ